MNRKLELLDQRTSDFREKPCILLLELHNYSTLPPPGGSISKLQEKLRQVNMRELKLQVIGLM